MDNITVEKFMKKRILFITPSIYPQRIGGIEIFNHYLAQELGKDYDVSLLNVDYNSSKVKLKNVTRKTIRNTSQFFQLLQIIFYLIKERKSYDLVWTSFAYTSWYYIIIYPFINIIFAKSYLIVIHGGGLMPWKWKFPYKLYFSRAKSIVGVSESICNEYKKRTGIEIINLPPLIPFTNTNDSKNNLRKKYNLNESDKIFLYVGSLKNLKRPEVILESFRELGKDYLKKHKVLVIFLGDGPLKNELMSYCRKESLERFFIFKGNIPREKINEYYKLSDYYIIPSDYEGTPISMLEAMNNQLPIIASNVRGINNIINGHNGILFDNNDTKSLSLAINKLMTDLDYSELLSQEATRYFNDNFSYQNFVDNYKKLI